MSWLPLRDRVRSLVLQWGFRVELLLLIKRSQLQHLTWMPPGCLLAEVFWACPTRKKPQGRVGTLGLHFSTGLVFPLKKKNEMAGEKEVLVSVQTAAPVTRTLSGRRWMDGSMDGWFLFYFYFIFTHITHFNMGYVCNSCTQFVCSGQRCCFVSLCIIPQTDSSSSLSGLFP